MLGSCGQLHSQFIGLLLCCTLFSQRVFSPLQLSQAKQFFFDNLLLLGQNATGVLSGLYPQLLFLLQPLGLCQRLLLLHLRLQRLNVLQFLQLSGGPLFTLLAGVAVDLLEGLLNGQLLLNARYGVCVVVCQVGRLHIQAVAVGLLIDRRCFCGRLNHQLRFGQVVLKPVFQQKEIALVNFFL